MKFKPQQEENAPKISSNIANRYIDLLEQEIDKMNFIAGAKMYLYNNGYIDHKKFFKHMFCECEKFKGCLVNYMIGRGIEIPEMTTPVLQTNFESAQSVFEEFAKLEDQFYDKLEALALQSFELKDMSSLAYSLSLLKDFKHLGCIANEAVKNNQNPYKLVEC